uniref:Uncharacterized protein n=1 Tax=Romanomermis culicivorax TaxID=13658 RepID=A0A915HN17_ROMCU
MLQLFQNDRYNDFMKSRPELFLKNDIPISFCPPATRKAHDYKMSTTVQNVTQILVVVLICHLTYVFLQTAIARIETESCNEQFCKEMCCGTGSPKEPANCDGVKYSCSDKNTCVCENPKKESRSVTNQLAQKFLERTYQALLDLIFKKDC